MDERKKLFISLNQLLEDNGVNISSVKKLEGEKYCYPTVRKNYDRLVEVM